jgi:hypothetical protein
MFLGGRGLQTYGGSQFKQLRARGDAIFLELPAPQPQNPPMAAFDEPRGGRGRVGGGTGGGGGGGGGGVPAPRAPQPIDMATYHAGAGGGCFSGTSTVVVWNTNARAPQTTAVQSVIVGDQVAVSDGEFATVVCVAEIARDLSTTMVILPGGLKITSRHPIRQDGRWCLPSTVSGAKRCADDGDAVVYNFVLSSSHVLIVNGMECITWGHGLKEPGVQHPFYGTQRVVNAMQTLSGWTTGRVQISTNLRDEEGHTVGFVAAL